MQQIRVRDLQEGMKFSKPLLSEEGDNLLPANKEIKRADINRFIQQGILTVETEGQRVDKGQNLDTTIKDKVKLEIKEESIKQQRSTPVETIGSTYSEEDEDFKKRLVKSEIKIDNCETYEQVVEQLSHSITSFIKSDNYKEVFKQNLEEISNTLIKQMRKHPYNFMDIVSFFDYGNMLVNHMVKVAIVSIYIAEKLDIPIKRIKLITIAALLHDIGKISYPIINELEGVKVSKEAMNLMVTHPVYGYKTCKKILELPEECCQAILNHHEQPDGKGFPRKVNGFKLSTADKVLSTANLFVNLIMKNNYNGYFVPITQLNFLNHKYPDKIDSKQVDVLVSLKTQKNPNYSLQSSTEEQKEVIVGQDSRVEA